MVNVIGDAFEKGADTLAGGQQTLLGRAHASTDLLIGNERNDGPNSVCTGDN